MRPLPVHASAAKKGNSGKVLIIGGSPDIHGAPILAALGSLAAGVDLVRIFLPACQVEVAREKNTNFLVSGFSGNCFSQSDVQKALGVANDWADVAIIGCGFLRVEIAAVVDFLKVYHGPTVIDAGGLQPEILPVISGRKNVLLTPHDGEFRRLFQWEADTRSVRKAVKSHNIALLKKGPVDFIVASSLFVENSTGCPEMSVGGTGDTLAGICGGLMAQGFSPIEAAETAAYFWGKAGEVAAIKKRAVSAEDMIECFTERVS